MSAVSMHADMLVPNLSAARTKTSMENGNMHEFTDRSMDGVQERNEIGPQTTYSGDQHLRHRRDDFNGGVQSRKAFAKDCDARLASIVETAVDGIITVDERGIIDTFNGSAEKLFGFRAEEMIGKHVSMLISPTPIDQRDEFQTNDRSASGQGERGTVQEAIGHRKDGSTFPLRLRVGEMKLGNKRFFTEIVHDISEEISAEMRARQAERLATIGQMLSVVAHESRNLIQRMTANLEMAAMESEGHSAATAYISRVRSAQNELEHLFDELSNHAAPITLDIKPCRLDHLVEQVLSELSALNNDRQISLRWNRNGIDPQFNIDPFRIRQVFRNMIENSLAACNDSPAIELT
ncbi:MAG: PAS domain S-box protein, partial [Planctomycetales bacterium]|nr:PAS domain S-box protein [Planctomycetales bacterium]